MSLCVCACAIFKSVVALILKTLGLVGTGTLRLQASSFKSVGLFKDFRLGL